MRILQLGKFYPIRGGVEKVEYDLTRGLTARGVECDMLCAGNEGFSGVVEEFACGKVFTCKTWFALAATMIAPTMIWFMLRHRKDYDIVHVHHPDPMAALALWCARYKGKVVLHWHSDIVQQHTAMKFYAPLQRWLIRRADKIVGTTPVYLASSPYLKDVQEKTVCMPIGIDGVEAVEKERTDALRARYGNRKMVFSLGRLVHYKGYEHLVKAAQYLDDDYVVLIGGMGPLRRDLERLIEKLKLNGKVILLGRVEDEELPVYYHACDVYCMSSVQKTEAFGIVQIEAMSCGKPLVATNIPGSGVSWVNKHGVSGMNAEPGDAEGLANCIKAIMADEETYNRFVQGSKDRFAQLFRYETMIEKCVDVYEGLSANAGC